MLDDDHGRRAITEFRHQFQRRIGIVVIVVRQFLALHLPRAGDAADMRPGRQIERRLLVRVLAITQFGRQMRGHHAGRREHMPLIGGGEPLTDRRVISRRQRIGLRGKGPALRQRGFAARHRRIIGRVGDNRHMRMVLRRRAHHTRPADVDVFDDLVAAGALGHRRRKRIQIHHHQIDRADFVLRHGCQMLGIVAHRQQAAVDLGMQRLDPPVHHLREPGEVGNIAHHQPRIAQSLRRAPGRDQIHALGGQRAAQIDQADLVRHR